MDNRNNIHRIDDRELQVIRRFIKKRFIEDAFKDFFFLFFNFDIEKRRGVTRPVIDENATSGKRWTRFETDRFGCKWKRIIREKTRAPCTPSIPSTVPRNIHDIYESGLPIFLC